jgi:hypothetical protein
MLNLYRTNCLQPGCMTAQLNYYRRSLDPSSTQPTVESTLGPDNKLRLPVLLIRGQDDAALLGGMFRDLDLYLVEGQYRLVEIENCSHWIQHDAPDVVNRELGEFLAQLNGNDVPHSHAEAGPAMAAPRLSRATEQGQYLSAPLMSQER